jgi:MSHA biogenesis protein MshL
MSSADVGKALLPPMSFPGEQVGDSDERFHIAVNRVPAREFFIGLVKGTGFNMVVHPDVEGRITLDLQSVTVDEVMEVVQSMYGYSFKKRGNIYHVLPDGLRTEMFHINYLNISRRGDSQIQVSAGQVSDVGSKGSGDSSSSIGPSTGMGTKITTSSTTDFWSELDQTLRLFIGGTEGQSIVMTPQAGVVVVRAMSDELDAVKSYLESAELILRRQVIIEAKILEVELNDGFQSGVNWSLLGKPSAGKTVGVGTTSADISSLSQIGGVFSAAASLSDFNGMINLLESQGNVQVLSSPRISTVNNQKAVIKVGSDRFFVTEVSSTQSSESNSGTDNNNFQSPTVELTPFFSGIALDVTPQISENDEVILHIHPSISTVKEEQKSIKAFGVQSDLPLAVSSIRETDSIVYAKSGQVVVIGGLMQNGSEDSDAGMPGLHNIPILGHLFKQKRSSSKKSELVILLRPRVIGPEGWNEMLQESSDQFEYLRNKMLPQ